jgi:hypothetical protein
VQKQEAAEQGQRTRETIQVELCQRGSASQACVSQAQAEERITSLNEQVATLQAQVGVGCC